MPGAVTSSCISLSSALSSVKRLSLPTPGLTTKLHSATPAPSSAFSLGRGSTAYLLIEERPEGPCSCPCPHQQERQEQPYFIEASHQLLALVPRDTSHDKVRYEDNSKRNRSMQSTAFESPLTANLCLHPPLFLRYGCRCTSLAGTASHTSAGKGIALSRSSIICFRNFFAFVQHEPDFRITNCNVTST
jgi:hypothetical protein